MSSKSGASAPGMLLVLMLAVLLWVPTPGPAVAAPDPVPDQETGKSAPVAGDISTVDNTGKAFEPGNGDNAGGNVGKVSKLGDIGQPDGGTASASASPEIQRQYKLAIQLYEEMASADNWELEVFTRNHRRVIDECPATMMAIESCWRLSNLYLTGKHQADLQTVVELMEHALRTYPGNRWEDRFIRRLVTVLENAGEDRKLLDVCEEQLSRADLPAERRAGFHLRAGLAAERLGRPIIAVSHFRKTLEEDAGRDSLVAGVARRHLAASAHE